VWYVSAPLTPRSLAEVHVHIPRAELQAKRMAHTCRTSCAATSPSATPRLSSVSPANEPLRAPKWCYTDTERD